MELERRCLKIDKTNAKAMIAGYYKQGQQIHQSIWCAVTDGDFPALVTLNRTKTKFPMSDLGESLKPEFYSIPYKYIAQLECQYPIKNDIKLWERLCTNGLFDVWDPAAPLMRFQHSRSPHSSFRIQLLRLYEINEEFAKSQVHAASDRVDHLEANRRVTIKAPVIQDEEFGRIKQLLETSIADFRTAPAWLYEEASQKRRRDRNQWRV